MKNQNQHPVNQTTTTKNQQNQNQEKPQVQQPNKKPIKQQNKSNLTKTASWPTNSTKHQQTSSLMDHSPFLPTNRKLGAGRKMR